MAQGTNVEKFKYIKFHAGNDNKFIDGANVLNKKENKKY